MRKPRFRRPLLCRLCECPAADGGVRFDRLDRHALSEWLSDKTGHRFDLEDEDEAESRLCQFCVWDARYEYENSSAGERNDLSVWWREEQEDKYFKYYFDDLLKPCFVKLAAKLETQPIAKNKVEIFCCLYCRKKVFSIKQLRLHSTKSHQNVAIRCPLQSCPVYFHSTKDRDEHCAGVHNRTKKLDCTCAEASSAGRCIYHNISTGGDEKPSVQKTSFSCVHCPKIFTHRKKMVSHICTVHRKVLVRCSYNRCSSYFKTEQEKQLHVESAHGSFYRNFKCVYCAKIYTGVEPLRLHVLTAHARVYLKCTYAKNCGAYFTSREQRDEHLRTKHGPRKALCVYCEQEFSDRYFLRMHVKASHGDCAIRCNTNNCGLFFRTDAQLKRHFDLDHAHLEKAKVHCCGFCARRFDRRDRLKRHVSRMHGSDAVECPKCGNKFQSAGALKKHYKKGARAAKVPLVPASRHNERFSRPRARAIVQRAAASPPPGEGARK